MVSAAKTAVAEMDGPVTQGRNEPWSRDIRMHYSFNFAQQVHLPSDSFQPGPCTSLRTENVASLGSVARACQCR